MGLPREPNTFYSESASRDEPVAQIHETLIIEQLFDSMTEEVSIWLRDRKLSTVKDVVDRFETFKISRGRETSRMMKKPDHNKSRENRGSKQGDDHKDNNQNGKSDKSQPKNTNGNNTKFSGRKDRGSFSQSKGNCFKCGQSGHISTSCPSDSGISQGQKGKNRDTSQGRGKNNGHNNGQGHNRKGQSQSGSKNTVAMCVSPDRSSGDPRDYMYPGSVEGVECMMYKDTAADRTLVLNTLIPKKFFTGEFLEIEGVGGKLKCPIAEIVLSGDRKGIVQQVIVVDSLPRKNIQVLLGLDSFEIIHKEVCQNVIPSVGMVASNVKTLWQDETVLEGLDKGLQELDLTEIIADDEVDRTFLDVSEGSDITSPISSGGTCDEVYTSESNSSETVLAVTRAQGARELARQASIKQQLAKVKPKVTPIGGDRVETQGKKQDSKLADFPIVFDVDKELLIKHQKDDKSLAPC